MASDAGTKIGNAPWDGVDAWDVSRQVLSTLRAPELWFERISETVRVVDDELERHVRVTITENPPIPDLKSMILAIQTPRKGVPIDAEIEQDARADVMSHRKHAAISRMMVMFRFRSVLRASLKEDGGLTITQEKAEEICGQLVNLVDSMDITENTAVLNELFTDKGALRGFSKGKRGSALREDMEALYLLSQTVSERYFKFIKIDVSPSGGNVLEYAYAQEKEARDYGFRGLRGLRRWFRAPRSLLFIHAPLARWTAHYELRLQPVDGYYVHQQFALVADGDPAAPTGLDDIAHPVEDHPSDRPQENASDDDIWMSTRRGGWTSGFLFVANGYLAQRRVFGAFRLLEVPPGATGRAWAGSFLGLTVIWPVVFWALMHEPKTSGSGPELLLALVAAGSAVLDNTMPHRAIFNSPFMPRLILFIQTILALATSVWLLVRGTSESMLPMDGFFGVVAAILTTLDVPFGILVLSVSLLITVVVTVRVITASRGYGKAMSEKNPS